MISFSAGGKKVTVYPAVEADRPLICLHVVAGDGGEIHRVLQKKKAPDCTLAVIGKLKWDHDMTPWDCPPISKTDTPCTGGADDYLRLFSEEILPEIEAQVLGKPLWRGIAGYSLAGLFAVYAVFRTDLFSRVASMSGSLWFPDFRDYVFSHEMQLRPDCMYFSLGDKEARTKNPYLCSVQDRTGEIQAFCAERGIDSVFQLNPGNHYVNAAERTAAGIDWILRR